MKLLGYIISGMGIAYVLLFLGEVGLGTAWRGGFGTPFIYYNYDFKK